MADETRILNDEEMVVSGAQDGAGATPMIEGPTVEQYALDLGGNELVAQFQAAGIRQWEDFEYVKREDLREMGLAIVPAGQLLKYAEERVQELKTAEAGDLLSADTYDVLPDVPDGDDSLLAGLKTGGILKIDVSTVTAAIKVALVQQIGLFELPEKIMHLMERQAEELEEPVSLKYFEMRDQMTRHDYGDFFAAIKGLNGTYMSRTRKNALLAKVNQNLWPALHRAKEALDAWHELLEKQMLPLGGLALALQNSALISLPSTGSLTDASEELRNDINRIFSGTGVQVTAAIAFEAVDIVRTLADEELPALVGATNREQMLKTFFDLPVSANFVRLEHDLSRFTWAFMNLDEGLAGKSANAMANYITVLWSLSNSIEWGRLRATKIESAVDDGRLVGVTGKAL